MSTIENVSRRGFLQGVLSTGAFVLSLKVLPQSAWAAAADSAGTSAGFDNSVLHPDLFLAINADGTVHIIAHRSEMGTTSRTSLPLIVADELDADWKRVKVEQAIGDARYGSQDTDGSHSVREFFEPMRVAGASGRLMLVRAAAQQWGVPESECTTELHAVVHKASNRRSDYGQLASAAAKLPVPKKAELQFKTPAQWRYIGKGMPSYDIEALCTGKAVFGMDAKLDGMLYASIEHPPVLGGKVKSYDDKSPLQVRGVRQIIPIDPFTPPHLFQPLGGVAVIADNTWAAFQGRKKLNIVWDNGANASYNSDEYRKQLRATSHNSGKVIRDIGNADAEFAKDGKVIEADYYAPHLAHASMEPPVALADYRDGQVFLWAPTQDPQQVQESVGKTLGIPKEKVVCRVPLLGGGFGRKSKPDYCVEAAILSKKTGRPVKVVWKREDDIQFDYFHSVAAMYMKAALDSKGKPTAWLQRSVFPPIGSTFALNNTYGGEGELGLGFSDIPFDIPNLRVENGPAENHVRIGWLRSVANIYHTFAVQSFADELAHAANQDSLEYLLALIGPDRVLPKDRVAPNYGANYDQYPFDTARLRHVTELAAEKAGWGKRKLGKGRGMGIAAHRSFLTYVATVVEVEVTPAGDVVIHEVNTAVDAGTVVNPETLKSQFEGAAVFGTSLALFSEITAKNGAIEQTNFHQYQVARMNQAPRKTNIYMVESNAPAAGVGEPGVPPFAPALCNAIFAATGKRIRELPISKTNLSS